VMGRDSPEGAAKNSLGIHPQEFVRPARFDFRSPEGLLINGSPSSFGPLETFGFGMNLPRAEALGYCLPPLQGCVMPQIPMSFSMGTPRCGLDQ
jgi:hypothetical protein